MFIETERTPNPDTLKFIPDRDVLAEGTAYFPDAEAARISPLAEALFGIDGVAAVFLAPDFISVTRERGDWDELKTGILTAIMDHYVSGRPMLTVDAAATADGAADGAAGEESETIRQIRAIIEEKVRPAVAGDGGDVVYHGFEDGIVYLAMQGACAGCPSATMTLKHGIENLLRYYVPDVREVRQV